MAHPELQAFHQKFRTDELCVLDTAHWTWSVRPAQPTLGCGVLALKRYSASFAEITPAESQDLQVAVARIEAAVGAAFQYDKINYLMLMMVDPHVHFHVIPRYGAGRQFAGREFGDEGWPAVPSLAATPSSDEELGAIRTALRDAAAG